MEIIGLLFALAIAVWVFSDAKSRGKSTSSSFLWSLGTFLLLIVFLPIWLVVRPKLSSEFKATEKPKLCAHCGRYYEGLPSFCPNCGKSITGS